MQVPPLSLSALPREPAGLSTSHTSRAIRLKHILETRQTTIFGGDEHEKPKRSVPLSHRELLAVKADKRKYANWLSRWDRDLGTSRFLMLEDFLKQCQGMSHAQLDDLFGHSSELVFIHMFAFLRLNFRRACSIALQLQALRVFFDASSGYCFAHQFLSSGGTALLLELLTMQDDLSPDDVREILNTFLSLTMHGPRAQQLMTETKLVSVFTGEIVKFADPELHKLTVMLFAQLAEGDAGQAEIFCNAFRSKFSVYAIQKLEALTTAAHIVRILFTPKLAAECDIKNTISDFLALTSTDSIEVQHAGIAIFQQLLNNTISARRKFLFDVVIDLITVNADEIPADLMEQRLRQQTFAVRLLQVIFQVRNETSLALYEQIQRLLPGIVRAIGNTENFATQKAACMVLAHLVDKWPDTRQLLTNAMPKEWVTALLTSPQQFCLQMTPTQIDTFQGAEPGHFFFDVTLDPHAGRARAKRELQLTDLRKVTMGQSKYPQQPIVMRPTALKYIPSSRPRTRRVVAAQGE
jgi:hypothetical protein